MSEDQIVQHFPAAAWPRSLKLVSLLGSLLLAGVTYGALRAIPPYGFAHLFGSFIACVPPAILLGSALFVVRGYGIDRQRLYVRRLLWTSSFPLAGFQNAWHDATATKGSIKVIGNGGLFSFTGLYRNKTLGRYRLFGTDPEHAVAFRLPSRILVITPADSIACLRTVRFYYPSVVEAPPV